MRSEDPDDIVVDAADAVTLNQDVRVGALRATRPRPPAAAHS